jgi:hypothetical protein
VKCGTCQFNKSQVIVTVHSYTSQLMCGNKIDQLFLWMDSFLLYSLKRSTLHFISSSQSKAEWQSLLCKASVIVNSVPYLGIFP